MGVCEETGEEIEALGQVRGDSGSPEHAEKGAHSGTTLEQS